MTAGPPHSNTKLVMKGFLGALAGGIGGGCLMPMLLAFLCAFFLKDLGGPVFWVFIAVGMGLPGAVIGFLVGSSSSADDLENDSG